MVVETSKWYLTKGGQRCLVVSIEDRLEPIQALCWVDGNQTLLPIGLDQLLPLSSSFTPEEAATKLSFIATASKLYDLLNSETSIDGKMISPIEASIEPLPHQLEILNKVMAGNSVRYMLADEVGLGKTIEAGLIIDELLIRHKIRRILIVVPKGLAMQWVLEMRNHFNLDFKFIPGSDISSLNEIFTHEGGLWNQFDRVIVSQDSIKPLTYRKGWNSDRIKRYNEERMNSLLSAKWDLIIIDEAHRLGGSTSSVARYKLGKELSKASPKMLLLTATPHQGKSDSFFRLLNILDDKAFPDADSVDASLVKRYVMRTEKRTAKDSEGNLLFQPRQTILKVISMGPEYSAHRKLYEDITEYVRQGYNQSIRNKKPHIGFLMVLLQRLLSSSTYAIHATLERRLAILEQAEEDATQSLLDASVDDDFDDLSSEEQQEEFIYAKTGILDEVAVVKDLLKTATLCINTKDDAKAVELEALISKVRATEKKAKFLIFTEFVPTQKMLTEYLQKRNFHVVNINGSMSIESRQDAQREFSESADVLISTDAGGEGLNLQFCHIIINYDLPWNPMKIEQRIGRVDRIGQTHPVTAYNFMIEDSVEFRVREVLEEKLRLIASEFGVDKTSDVLESDASAQAYSDAFTASVMNPDKVEYESEKAITIIKSEMKEERQFRKLIATPCTDSSASYADVLQNHPFRYWTEQLIRYYLEIYGGTIKEGKKGYSITWPDKSKSTNITFDSKSKDLEYLSLSDPRVREIYSDALKPFQKGETIPIVHMPRMPKGLSGNWGLFLYNISNEHPNDADYIKIPDKETRLIPIFIADNGAVYNATAEKLWVDLISEPPVYIDSPDHSEEIYSLLYSKAALRANALKDEIISKWEITISEELARLQNYYIFQEDRSEKSSLEEVRSHRQMQLAIFNSKIDEEIQSIRTVHPELICISMLRLEAVK